MTSTNWRKEKEKTAEKHYRDKVWKQIEEKNITKLLKTSKEIVRKLVNWQQNVQQAEGNGVINVDK